MMPLFLKATSTATGGATIDEMKEAGRRARARK
jgi:hypothetical protein